MKGLGPGHIICVLSRISDSDFQILKSILENVPNVKFICLDVANGYSQFFVDYVKKVRDNYPDHTIMVRPIIFSASLMR